MNSGIEVVILAGGLGSTVQPASEVIPICLMQVGGRPILDYWVNSLAEARISTARVISHPRAEGMSEYIGAKNAAFKLFRTESDVLELPGLAKALVVNAALAADAHVVVILNGSSLTDIDLRSLITFHCHHNDPFTMVLLQHEGTCDGMVDLDAEGRIVSFTDKTSMSGRNLVDAGLYVIDAQVFREIATMGALNLSVDVFRQFAGQMRGWVWGGYYLAIETIGELERARREIPLFILPQVVSNSNLGRPAIFLDRDGTVIKHVHYLCDPAMVQLLPGVAEALRRFRRAGFARVLVTNQSAIGRGMLTVQRLEEIHAEMNRQLAECGATIDAIYYCPDMPASEDQTVVETPDRKPGPGMLLRAAADLQLDLTASWMIGDLMSDVLAGRNAGCRSILLEPGQTVRADAHAFVGQFLTAPDLAAAADSILANHGVET